MMSKGMLVWDSVLAGLQVLAGASAVFDWVDPRWVGLAVVVVAAIQAATATYKRGLGVPAADKAPRHEL
jgi:hypothetical protein